MNDSKRLLIGVAAVVVVLVLVAVGAYNGGIAGSDADRYEVFPDVIALAAISSYDGKVSTVNVAMRLDKKTGHSSVLTVPRSASGAKWVWEPVAEPKVFNHLHRWSPR